jgi:uncharacterized membrane protein YfcA
MMGSILRQTLLFISLNGNPAMIENFLAVFIAYKFFFLWLVGILAGAVDAVAGGGGLISLPILMISGLPVHTALGTNKLQASFGTAVAAYHYFKEGLIASKTIINGLFFGLLGTVLGAFLASSLDNDILRQILPFLMIAIFVYSVFSPHLGVSDQTPKLNENYFYLVFGLLLGFYDGFFGPGTGSLWIMAFVFFLGYSLVKATAYTKIFNLKSNLIAFTYFSLAHQVDYKVGFIMAAGQLLGGKIGAYLAIKNGSKFIRLFFLMVVLATILMSLYLGSIVN